MKLLLIKVKNLLPYLFLIAIYFFFVNIEARNNQNNYLNNNKKIGKAEEPKEGNLEDKEKVITISIPVIPYNQ